MTSPTRFLERRLVRAFLLTAIVPLFLFAALSGLTTANSLRDETFRRQQQLAQSEASRVSLFLEDMQNEVQGWGAMTMSANLPLPTLRDLAANFIKDHEAYREISIMDSTGQELVRATAQGPTRSDLLQRRDEEEKFFRAARGEIYYSWVRFADDGPYLSLSVPVVSDRDPARVQYVVSADVRLSDIWRHIETIAVGQSGYGYLVDRRGTLIAYRDETMVREQLDVSDLPAVRDALAGVVGAVHEYRGLNGQPVLGVSAHVDAPGWAVVIERPTFEAFGPAGQLFVIATALLIVSCLAAILVGSILSRRITQPIALLERGARELGSGELLKPLVVRTGDEIERLADEFNRMAGNLQHSRAEIEASAREREQLYRQVSGRAKEMTALHMIALEIGAQLELDPLLQSLVRRAVELLQADGGAVFFWEQETRELQMMVSHKLDSRYANLRLKRGEGVAGQVILTNQPLVVNDYTNWPHRMQDFSAHAVAAAPLLGAQGALGVLSIVTNAGPRSYSPEDLDLLNRFAAQAAIAIQNARLYHDEQEARLLAQKLSEAALMLGGNLDLDDLLTGIWAQLRQVVAYDCGAIFLLEQDWLRVHSAAGFGSDTHVESLAIRLTDDLLFSEIARTGQALVLADAQADSRFRQYAETSTTHGWLGVPLFARGRLIGCMTLDKLEPGYYRPADAKAAQAFAAQAAVAIENARLYAEAQQRTAELVAALQERQELDRLKNEFIQNTSHELRTPLGLIRGYAELLDTGELGPVPEEQRQAISVIHRRTRDLSSLVESLMAILQAEAGAIVQVPLQLQDIAAQTVRDFEATANKQGLSLHLEVEGTPPTVQGDPSHLRRVFDNLTANAFKFTPQGGSVTIRVRPEVEGVRVEVRDTGIGIPQDKLSRVFERFYQVDGTARRRHGGVGLGLALVKEIVETHGGRVGIASQVDRGTTIWFWLPGEANRET